MNLDLSGKTALVCGSTQGLGYASAKELALLGANIILMARNEEKLIEAVASLPKTAAQNHSFLVADFIDTMKVKTVINDFVKSNTVHILVNNTGGPAGGPALTATTDQFLQAFNDHLINNHNLAQAVVPGGLEPVHLLEMHGDGAAIGNDAVPDISSIIESASAIC